MLVERYGFLGGLATGGLVLYMDGLFDADGRRCTGGVDASAFRRFSERRGDALARIDADLRKDGGFPIRLGRTPYSEAGVYWVNVLGLAGIPSGAPAAAADDSSQDEGAAVVRHFAGRLDATRVENLSAVEVFLRRRCAPATARSRETWTP